MTVMNIFKISLIRNHLSGAAIWKMACIFLIILSLIGFTLIRITEVDSPLYQDESYKHCQYQIYNIAQFMPTDQASIDKMIKENPGFENTLNTPQNFTTQADLVAVVEILDISPIGNGDGWMYNVKMVNDLSLPQNNAAYQKKFYLFHESISGNKLFNSSSMVINFQSSELMLWKGNKYIVFADHVYSNAFGTDYSAEDTYKILRYDSVNPFCVIPVKDDIEISSQQFLAKDNSEIVKLKPLIVVPTSTESNYLSSDGISLIYNSHFPAQYSYTQASQYNCFFDSVENVDYYQNWCYKILDALKNQKIQ